MYKRQEVLRGLQHYSKFVDLVIDYGRNQLNPCDDEDETERPEFSDDEGATSSNVGGGGGTPHKTIRMMISTMKHHYWTMESRVIEK